MLSWRVPDNLNGRFRAILEVKMGPFPVDVGREIAFDLAASRLRLPEPLPGQPAPDFVLPGMDETTVQLSFLRDRPVVLCFFCPCDACRALASALAKRVPAGGRPYVLAVFSDPLLASTDVDDFRQATGFTGAALRDADRSASFRYRVFELPRVFVVGADGCLRHASDGREGGAEQAAAAVIAALDGK
jgi:peroxiredoxin